MVSTRGPRYKFAEGEKVLCYEPDPTKAKVLYDSKVLQVIKNKDKRGRPVIEYLIHFQGWNSSWDRCVSEDFVLKDTEENRQLQKSLAEKSQLQIGAYLYRRERKKTTSNAGSSSGVVNVNTEKRAKKRGLECEGSSSSGDHEERDSDTSSRSDSSCLTAEDQKTESTPDPQASLVNANINLGPGIKNRLMLDFQFVTKQGRVPALPAKPSVLEILEGFVKQYATREIVTKPRQRRSRAPDPPQPQDQIVELSNKLNLIHEVADGIRIYFDYLLNSHLLYKPEFIQYKEAVSKNIIKEVRCINESDHFNNTKYPINKNENQSPQEEYAHLPPSPKLDDSLLIRDRCSPPIRRLRSHKVSQASETSDEHLSGQPINVVPGTSNMDPSSSSVSDSPGHTDLPNLTSDVKGAIAEILQKTLNWHIVPPDYPPFPSAVYGATHLARLFVKLPEFLSAINMAEMKLKLIVKHVEMFVDYLEEHEEWFGETYYCEASSTVS